MFSFVGAHYQELVVGAMTIFAICLFSVSVADARHGGNSGKPD